MFRRGVVVGLLLDAVVLNGVALYRWDATFSLIAFGLSFVAVGIQLLAKPGRVRR